jgi:ubiquinone/menaquinone biosynthesis C-methylase UbiE
MTEPIQVCTYFTGCTNESDQSNWIHLITKYIPNLKERNVLDVGCNIGYLLTDLSKSCKTATGVDIEPLESETLPGFKFVRSDCHKLPFEDKSFDLVISLGMLEHVDDYESAILEMKRVLSDGGYMFLFLGPTPLWTYFDKPAHRQAIPRHPRISETLRLLQDGSVKKIWNENIQYRLFDMDSFTLFPTNPTLSKLFKSMTLRKLLLFVLTTLENNNLEQNICLVYKHNGVAA